MISTSSGQTESDVTHLLRQHFEALPYVSSVLLAKQADSWGVVVFVTVNDQAAREHIYECGREIETSALNRDLDLQIVLAGDAGPIPSTSAEWRIVFQKTSRQANP